MSVSVHQFPVCACASDAVHVIGCVYVCWVPQGASPWLVKDGMIVEDAHHQVCAAQFRVTVLARMHHLQT